MLSGLIATAWGGIGHAELMSFSYMRQEGEGEVLQARCQTREEQQVLLSRLAWTTPPYFHLKK